MRDFGEDLHLLLASRVAPFVKYSGRSTGKNSIAILFKFKNDDDFPFTFSDEASF